jgi:hypothetical protein
MNTMRFSIFFYFLDTVHLLFRAIYQFRTLLHENQIQLLLDFKFFLAIYWIMLASCWPCNRQLLVSNFYPLKLWWISLIKGYDRMFWSKSWISHAKIESSTEFLKRGFIFYLVSAKNLEFWPMNFIYRIFKFLTI